MRYLRNRHQKLQLFQFTEELAEIYELQDFLDLKEVAIARGYDKEFEDAISLQDTAYKRSIMRDWLVGNYEQVAVPLVEHFIPVNLRSKEQKNAHRNDQNNQETSGNQKASRNQGGDREAARTKGDYTLAK